MDVSLKFWTRPALQRGHANLILLRCAAGFRDWRRVCGMFLCMLPIFRTMLFKASLAYEITCMNIA